MNPSTRTRAILLVLCALGILVVCLLRVQQQHQVIQVGYQLSQARTLQRKFHEEQNRLRLEESVLTNPGRIEKLANSIGMIRPTPDQLRVIAPRNLVLNEFNARFLERLASQTLDITLPAEAIRYFSNEKHQSSSTSLPLRNSPILRK